VTKNKNINRRN